MEIDADRRAGARRRGRGAPAAAAARAREARARARAAARGSGSTTSRRAAALAPSARSGRWSTRSSPATARRRRACSSSCAARASRSPGSCRSWPAASATCWPIAERLEAGESPGADQVVAEDGPVAGRQAASARRAGPTSTPSGARSRRSPTSSSPAAAATSSRTTPSPCARSTRSPPETRPRPPCPSGLRRRGQVARPAAELEGVRRRLLAAACSEFSSSSPSRRRAGGRRDRRAARHRTDSVADRDAERERELGFDVEQRFSRAVEGFAADLTPAQVAELRADPEVAAVVADRPVHAPRPSRAGRRDRPARHPPRDAAAPPATVREAATAPSRSLDTGVDLDAPRPERRAGTNCTGAGTPDDVDGHGTHVAGTIGARNNGSGVIGVAPGTKIVAVKVLDDDGCGSTSTVLCGIEWVLANRVALDIKRREPQPRRPRADPLDVRRRPRAQRLLPLVSAGVAPGRRRGQRRLSTSAAAPRTIPAAYPEVLTVAAMTDTDGLPGASGRTPSCAAATPTTATPSFSNFATTAADAAHLVAAPGRASARPRRAAATRRCRARAWPRRTSPASSRCATARRACAGPVRRPVDARRSSTHLRTSAAAAAFTGLAGRLLRPAGPASAPRPPAAADPQPDPEPVVVAPTPQRRRPRRRGRAHAHAAARAAARRSAEPRPAPVVPADPVLDVTGGRLGPVLRRGLTVRVTCPSARAGQLRACGSSARSSAQRPDSVRTAAAAGPARPASPC